MKLKKVALLWLLMGEQYFVMEAVWRAFKGERVHIAMLIVAGLCGLAVGAINQIPRFYKLRMIWQCLIGTAITLCVEFASGCILNLWMGLNIWSYANMPLNLLGQICLPFAGMWLVMMPLAIWMEDEFRAKLFNDGTAYPWWQNFVELWNETIGWVFRKRPPKPG